MDAKVKKLIKSLCYPWSIGYQVRQKSWRRSRGRRVWTPLDEYKVPGAFNVYPESYFKHAQTLKYAKLLFEHRPDLYFELQHLDPELLKVASCKEDALVAAVILKEMVE